MAGITLDPPPAAARSFRGTAASLILLAVAAIVFVAIAAVPYFIQVNAEKFGDYWPRRGWLLLHITGGMVAILAGPVQLWLGVTDRRPELHKRLGIVYLTAVTLGAIGGFYLAVTTTISWLFGLGLGGLATAWTVTSGMAFAAIKRGAIDQHKEWMIRSYVVTFAFVGFRVVFPTLQALQIGTLPEALIASAWLCWTVPLLIAEAVIQGRKILSVRAF